MSHSRRVELSPHENADDFKQAQEAARTLKPSKATSVSSNYATTFKASPSNRVISKEEADKLNENVHNGTGRVFVK